MDQCHALPPRLQIDLAVLAQQPLDGIRYLAQRDGRIGGREHVHLAQLQEALRPRLDVHVPVADVDDLAAGLQDLLGLPRRPVEPGQRTVEVAYLDGEEHVGLRQRVARARDVEAVRVREVEAAAAVVDRHRQDVGELGRSLDGDGVLPQHVRQHHRVLGLHQHLSDRLNRARVQRGRVRRHEPFGVHLLHLDQQRVLLQVGVVHEVRGPVRRRGDHAVRPSE